MKIILQSLCGALLFFAAIYSATVQAASIYDYGTVTLHLDAGSLSLADGDVVQSWASSAPGSSHALQSSDLAGSPTYIANGFNGQAAVRFDGSDDTLWGNGANIQAQTIFVVTSVGPAPLNWGAGLISNGADQHNIRRDGVNDRFRSELFGRGSEVGDFGSGAGGEVRVDGVNGANFTISDPSAPVPHLVHAISPHQRNYVNFLLGDGAFTGPASGRFWSGDVAEVIVYDGPLNLSQTIGVQNYLTQKYDLDLPVLENVALNKTAWQSTTSGNFSAGLAVDGDVSGVGNNFTHTLGASDLNPWWQVDLGAGYDIEAIVIHNRRDGFGKGRLRDITVEILDKDENVLWTSPLLNENNEEYGFGFPSGANHTSGPDVLEINLVELLGEAVEWGQFVRISREVMDTDDPNNFANYRVLALAEVEVFSSALSVPEPSALALASLATIGVTFVLRRRRVAREAC